MILLPQGGIVKKVALGIAGELLCSSALLACEYLMNDTGKITCVSRAVFSQLVRATTFGESFKSGSKLPRVEIRFRAPI